jgi:hypothetical protein
MPRVDLSAGLPPWRWRVAAALLLAFAVTVAVPAGAAGRCALRREAPVEALSSIELDPHGFPDAFADVPARAVALWTRRDCIGDADFPVLTLAPGAGERRIEVLFRPGPSTVLPSACGEFVGSRIVLHGKFRDPRDGRLVSCGGPDRLVETLAHELGHALGLRDQFDPACSDHIMAQLARGRDGLLASRRVQPDECRVAGSGFTTAFERAVATGRDLLAADLESDPRRPRLRPESVLPPSLPPAARTARDIHATGSAVFRP